MGVPSAECCAHRVSTGAIDPAYDDTRYVGGLIAPAVVGPGRGEAGQGLEDEGVARAEGDGKLAAALEDRERGDGAAAHRAAGACATNLTKE